MYRLKISLINAFLLALTLVFLALSLVYLTPLKNIALIEPPIKDMTPTEFYEKYKDNVDEYVFIDVRNEAAYNRLHAEGAKLMPLHTLYTERLFLPKNEDKTIVLICSGGVASGVGFHYLEHHGFFNILRIDGGIEAWQEAGLPVVSTE